MTHMRIHTGEKRKNYNEISPGSLIIKSLLTFFSLIAFHCKTCDKTFTQASSLSVHQKVHATAEKQFKCQHCSKSYSQQSYLTKHMLFHNGNTTYTCKWCNKPFNDSAQLIHHVAQEHNSSNGGNSVAECIICRKEFTSAPALLFHLREHVENGEQTPKQEPK